MVKIYRHCVLFLIATGLAGLAAAQDITLSVRQADVKTVFLAIEKQAKVSFVYNENTLKGLGAISLKAFKMPLADVLKNLAGQVPLAFKQSGTVIGVTRTDGKEEAAIPSEKSLDEVQVVGYGTTTKRLNTGSVAAVSAAVIDEQPVTNVLSSLAGRVPGAFVQTTNGMPGGNITIQIRGQGSIAAGSNPLYVIDGVPFSSSVGSLTALSVLSTGSINGLISPLNSLNPADIESISILKDADATAIYGSRGSNGVVLITTKKGKAGKTRADASVSGGVTGAANIPRLLNYTQFLQMRRTAYTNDGVTPSADPNSNAYAPDLTTWSNNPPTDWAKYLLGNTGQLTNAQASVSGGDGATSFLVSGNYHSEKTYLPGDNLYNRGGLSANFQHTSANRKFMIQFSTALTLDHNALVNPVADIAYDLLLPPNYPVFSAPGTYNWYAGENPVAEIQATSTASTNNVISNLLLSYNLFAGLTAKVSAGYNSLGVNQTQIFPSVSLYPGTLNYTYFGRNSNQSYIIEPQITYDRHFQTSTLDLLLGGTYQDAVYQGESIKAGNFSSASLMNNLGSAGTFVPTNSHTEYKYASVFGRVTYNLDEKYILNATVRRDGSSRFGPNEQFGNFGSIGAAWLWDEEGFARKNLPFVSYGKLRASYGLTGNDQIADYQYLPTDASSGFVYQGIPGLKPSRIANPDFHWETTKKLDVGLELGFLKNNILLTVDRYQDLTSDQLVAYAIPSLTGFTSYQANLPAVVENAGWEFELTTKNIQGEHFKWTTTFNLTLPRNELKSFPGLASSGYANTLVVGQDINRVYGYQFEGLSAAGSALYATKSGVPSSTPSSATDSYYTIGKKTPDLYGGIGTTLSYGNWSLDIFGQFVKQATFGDLTYIPGAQGFNNYAAVNRISNIPKASNTNDFNYGRSSANFFNTSYFRLKNIALAYTVSSRLRIFAQAQNMLTFWNRNLPLLDPESGTFNSISNNLPPARSVVAGIQTTF
jgi:TonB-linked SusC/RagA family outer membrane protein